MPPRRGGIAAPKSCREARCRPDDLRVAGREADLPHIGLSDRTLERLQRGSKRISLGIRQPPGDLLGLPWGSIVRLNTGETSVRAIANPDVYRGGQWLLPVSFGIAHAKADMSALKKQAMRDRHLSGLDCRRSVPQGRGR